MPLSILVAIAIISLIGLAVASCRRSAPSRAKAPALRLAHIPRIRRLTADWSPFVPPLDSGETIRRMSDGVVSLSLVVGFGFILIAGSHLGAGSLAGLFAARGVRDWPTGVQEGDAPRFAVRHLDGLRPGSLP